MSDIYADPSAWRARAKRIDANLEELKRNQLPHQPQQWEKDKALCAEVITLRARVAELEAQIDSMVDAAVECQIALDERAPYVYPGRGRPKGVKERKPRQRRAK